MDTLHRWITTPALPGTDPDFPTDEESATVCNASVTVCNDPVLVCLYYSVRFRTHMSGAVMYDLYTLYRYVRVIIGPQVHRSNYFTSHPPTPT